MPDVFTKEKRSEIMAKIRGKDTKIEIALRRELWKSGIRGYRLRMKLPGRPDIAFPKYKVAIFCDGDFWHGYKFSDWKDRLPQYWLKKIYGNMERDKENDLRLAKDGWLIIHFWEHELEKNVAQCKQKVYDVLTERGFKK